MNEQVNTDIEKNNEPVLDAHVKEPGDCNSTHDEWTIESIKEEIRSFYPWIIRKYRCASIAIDQGAHMWDEIHAMDLLLKKHNIKFTSKIHLDGKNYNNWDDKSLYERNRVIRQSLRKSDDGSTFKMVTYRRDNPCNRREELLTKKEAIEWLQSAGATDAEIFNITGDIPVVVADGDFLPFRLQMSKSKWAKIILDFVV